MTTPTPEAPSALQLEPIRLPAWAVFLATIFGIPIGVAILTSGDWKAAAATSLLTSVPYLVVSERARTRSVPKVKHDSDLATTRAIAFAAAAETAETTAETSFVAGRDRATADLEAIQADKARRALEKRRANIAAKAEAEAKVRKRT